MSALSVAARRGAGLAASLERWLVGVRPVTLLAPLIALQLAQVAWFALKTPHNGWIYYSGGDATSYWTEQYAVGHLQIPQAVVGYGLPVYYAWVPLIAGPSLMTGSAIIVVFQALVLVPLALVLFWAVSDRLFGRVFAWAAAALWVAAPLLFLHGAVPKYHWIFDQLFLAPHWFGLTNMADLPSLVIVLATMWLTLRAFDTGSTTDAVLGGLMGGLAIGVKPSNAFLLPAVLVLLVGSRSPRLLGAWAAALVPALITLTVWKYRGLGYLPATSTSYEPVRLAAGSHPIAFSGSKYLPLNLHHFGEELSNLREVFWSLRFLEFLAVAGAFGVIRKSPVKGLFVVVWFVSYGIIKSSSPRSDFPSATYFRLADPGLPAYLLLALGVAFCLPRLGRRVAPKVRTAASAAIDWRWVAPAAVVLAFIPLMLVVGLRNPKTPLVARDGNVVQEAPLTNSLDVKARRNRDGTVTVTWRKQRYGSTTPTYLVYLSATGSDNGCTPPAGGANECMLDTMSRLVLTPDTHFVDRPKLLVQARWYRVAVLSNYQKNINGDLMLVSSPVLAPPYRAS